MSKVFLLSSNVTTDPYPVYPLGMALVASALSGRGHTVRQFDYLVAGKSEERLRADLKEFSPDFVGLSLRNIDNVDSFSSDKGWYLADARHLIDVIREETEKPVIVGGPAFSIMPAEILDYLGADYGIFGEGERVFSELIEALEAGKEMPSLIGGEDAPLKMEQMCHPLLEQEFVDFYLAQSGLINLQTKRGCPHNCVYCTYPSLEGTRFRPRDPKAVADDIERLKRDFNIPSVFFTDSVFNDANGHYILVAEELLRRDLGVKWCGFFRPKGISRKELALLKRSGLYAMELGTDAASDTTLKGIGKGFTFADALEVHRNALAEEIPCAHFIMFGGPDETPQTVQEGLANIEMLENGVVFGFSGIRILPGTQLHQRAIEDGILEQDAPLLKPVYYFSPHVDPDAMNETIEKAFRGRKDRIFPPSEGQERMAVMQRFGFRGILWDKLISFSKKREKGMK